MGGGRSSGHPQGDGFQSLSPEALSLHRKDNRIIKDAVKSAQEGVVLTEILLPPGGVPVAGKNHVVIAVLLVAAVNHVKEQPGVLLVKLTMPHLVNNQTGRPHKRGQQRSLTACTPRVCHTVSQFRHLNEVGFQSLFTAGPAKSLGQVGLSRSRLANKGKILVGVECRERGKAPQLLHILPGNAVEIKVVKGLRRLQRQAAGTQQELE